MTPYRQLEILFEKIEQARAGISASVKELTGEKLNASPAQGKWSILQIIFHLVKTEKIVVISIRKNLTGDKKLNASGLMPFIRANLLYLFLRTNLKAKAPAIVASVPETYNFNELLSQWEKTRKSLKEIIDSFPSEHINNAVFYHPYSGGMNIKRTLIFVLRHMEHHEKQIISIIK